MDKKQPGISTIRVSARGEDFRVVQVSGNLFVCSKENGSCCCGWEEKGRLPVANSQWSDEWERRGIRNRLHLTFSGCLGPCVSGNNALLQIHGQSIWLFDLNDPSLIGPVFDYAEQMLAAGAIVSPPGELEAHIQERYLHPGHNAWRTFGQTMEPDGGDGLDRLDPVCLMDVDPDTAKHRVEYEGRTIVFCAPACKKQFLAAPESFLPVFAGG